ncbi:unnamed protein product, partial [Prorocentrum cordatum]
SPSAPSAEVGRYGRWRSRGKSASGRPDPRGGEPRGLEAGARRRGPVPLPQGHTGGAAGLAAVQCAREVREPCLAPARRRRGHRRPEKPPERQHRARRGGGGAGARSRSPRLSRGPRPCGTICSSGWTSVPE